MPQGFLKKLLKRGGNGRGMISSNDSDITELQNVLSQAGPLGEKLAGFELRDEQIQMACAVKKAFDNKKHLSVEAGTGVGKSFAYLIPAIERVNAGMGKILVSTYTITLQEQLINKDLPFLSEALPWQFTAALAKGRGNFVCLRRLAYAGRKQAGLFDNVSDELAIITAWTSQTSDGSLSDLSSRPSAKVWDAVKSEHGNCRGRKCEYFKDCFYWRNRRRLESADIIVANHALLFSDLVLKEHGASVLCDYSNVIIDEAHNIEQVAEDHFGINISNYTLSFMLNGLYNPRSRKGLLAYTGADETIELVKKCDKASRSFFENVQDWFDKNGGNGRTSPNFVPDNITEPIKNLRLSLNRFAKETKDPDEQFEFARYIDRCSELESSLKDFLAQSKDSAVYWIESRRSNRRFIALRSAPLNVGPDVKRCLFDKLESVITTSATLSCDGKGQASGFEFFASRIGLEDFEALKLGSPFDYEKQVTMYVEADLPEPNDPTFEAEAAEKIKKYLKLSGGKAFVLFTSYSMLHNMAEELKGWLKQNSMTLLQQGDGEDRTALLSQFKRDTNSVLFGTDSFWQGVDVPGVALSNVIIVRLPFAVPNHPLVQGRIEQIRDKGENPFFKYQLPWAIIKFKQGFGRLIRNKTDAGMVVVLDSRIVRKNYGKEFLAAIPKCKIEMAQS